MAELIPMPRLGQSMEEGTVLQWFKQEGESVVQGEPLYEVMSDKANIEVESPSSGVLRKILAPADTTLDVGAPVAILGLADEPIDHLLNSTEQSAIAASVVVETTASTSAPALSGPSLTRSGGGLGAISPRARRLADQKGISLDALIGRGSGPRGRVLERDVEALAATGEKGARVTPLAARVADDLGVDPNSLALGLPGSRIRAEDVRMAAQTSAPAFAPVAAEDQLIPLRGLRKLVAENVVKAKAAAPHVTLVAETDAGDALKLVAAMAPGVLSSHNAKLTLTHVIIKACALALKEHPYCNAAFEEKAIRLFGQRNICCAVAVKDGLLAPVIHLADTLPLGRIAAELRDLAGRCRDGKQTPNDLQGGTFTISSLGPFGVDLFNPILNGGQACILGVGRVSQKPAVVEGQIVPRPLMNLCLTFDHRVLDGAPAAQFLAKVKSLIEAPYALFE